MEKELKVIKGQEQECELTILNNAAMSVATAASEDETRYVLCGLFLDDNKIVATNGMILLTTSRKRIPMDEFLKQEGLQPEKGKLIITNDVITDAKKLRKRCSTLPYLSHPAVYENVIVTANTDTAHHIKHKPIEGVYPNYDSIFNQHRKEMHTPGATSATLSIGSHMLKSLLEAAEELHAECIELTIVIKQDEESIHDAVGLKMVDSKDASSEVTGAFMPMRKRDEK